MGLFDLFRSRETRDNIQNPTVPVSASNFLAYFGINSTDFPAVTVESALTVPAVLAAVTFLPATMAALPLHAYRNTKDADGNVTTDRILNGIDSTLGYAPNDQWTSFGWRQYFWTQVFTIGRGLSYIERGGPGGVANIWPIDAARCTVKHYGAQGLEKRYLVDGIDGKQREYDAADIIDIPFMLRHDQVSVYGPIAVGGRTIQRAIAMAQYAAGFFAGGGVPPLTVTGPLPAGPDAMKRATADIERAIKSAQSDNKPIVQLPPGYKLEPIGFDPSKGQMTEAMQQLVQEIARIWGLPPVFLQDLTHGTYSNTEQQDLNFVKHVVRRWAIAFEQELNLKLFGRKNAGRHAEHNLDGLLRGDLVARMGALSQSVQNGLLTPNEGRALDNRPPMDGGDGLFIQGATVPLNQAGNNQNGKTLSNAAP